MIYRVMFSVSVDMPKDEMKVNILSAALESIDSMVEAYRKDEGEEERSLREEGLPQLADKTAMFAEEEAAFSVRSRTGWLEILRLWREVD